ncbi:hypothetical protein B4119_3755 [Parageobacillus caldoxylosilyticus]|uniref:Uncharacterized protein n=1 Tax=Saccharococcus caldoxylosilyticus TaxID=81408 RepID=A0A150M3C3_9BACL|nr:hypothetical protein B4119_3755 [Parageobacillus caldoxylosilyticus]
MDHNSKKRWYAASIRKHIALVFVPTKGWKPGLYLSLYRSGLKPL